jgi:hypothetical protein
VSECVKRLPAVDAPVDPRAALKRAHLERDAALAEMDARAASVARCEDLLASNSQDFIMIDEMERAAAQRRAEGIAAGKTPAVDDGLAQSRARAEQNRADLQASFASGA